MRHEGRSPSRLLPKANVSSQNFSERDSEKGGIGRGSGIKRIKHHVHYCQHFAVEAASLMDDGLKKWKIADHFGVCANTLRKWAAEHPEFQAAMGRPENARLYDRLILRAKTVAIDIQRATEKATKLDAKVADVYRRSGLAPPAIPDCSIHAKIADLIVEAQVLERRIAAAEKLL